MFIPGMSFACPDVPAWSLSDGEDHLVDLASLWIRVRTWLTQGMVGAVPVQLSRCTISAWCQPWMRVRPPGQGAARWG